MMNTIISMFLQYLFYPILVFTTVSQDSFQLLQTISIYISLSKLIIGLDNYIHSFLYYNNFLFLTNLGFFLLLVNNFLQEFPLFPREEFDGGCIFVSQLLCRSFLGGQNQGVRCVVWICFISNIDFDLKYKIHIRVFLIPCAWYSVKHFNHRLKIRNSLDLWGSNRFKIYTINL